MTTTEESIQVMGEAVIKERKIVNELREMFGYLKNIDDEHDRRLVKSHIERLKIALRDTNNALLELLEGREAMIARPLQPYQEESPELYGEIIPEAPEMQVPAGTKRETKAPSVKRIRSSSKIKEKIPELDKEVLKRLKKKEKKTAIQKEKKPSAYVKFANRLFSEKGKKMIKEKKLISLEKDLIKSNLGYTPVTYISIMIFTIIVSACISVVIFIFLLFFNITTTMPLIIPVTEPFLTRLIETFWIMIVVPLGTFLFMYIYPSLEKKSLAGKINQELPFAAIHMAAISGSMIEPTKIFSIICSTKEYPHLEKEFNKLLNEINVYGYDIVTALKDVALNNASQKLSELLNGMATTITSGGDLFEFFDKRSQTLLFEYRLDREKQTKSAETFMDIYISVVIAAPMILMLLLMMMQISGLGVGIGTSTLTFLVIAGVSLINVFFLIFLQLKHQSAD